MNLLRALIRDETGGPAAEMALALPMVMALLFGGMEGGYFFWREHQVVKASREGARFASRQPLGAYDCAAGTVDTAVNDGIGQVANANLVGTATVTVSVSCATDSQSGLYATQANGAPVVRVFVQLPYRGLFSTMVLGNDLTLNSASQALVMGL